MRKQFVAFISILLFGAGLLLAPNVVSGHTTLGGYSGLSPFYVNESDTHPSHVPGPLAYVWPGSGLGALIGPHTSGLSGYPLFPPGYQVPNPSGYPPSQPANVYQLQSSAYSPFGAILASTINHEDTGSLIFALSFWNPCYFSNVGAYSGTNSNPHNNHNTLCQNGAVDPNGPLLNFTGVSIYIPPEFDLSQAIQNQGLIQTTFAASYTDFYLTKSDVQDPIGPGWWLLDIEGNIQFWPQHNYLEWYYVRINNVGAPVAAGKYFFKIFLWDSVNPEINVPGSWDTLSSTVPPFSPAGAFSYIPSGPTTATVPAANWPVILVKGEVDPGIVTGSVRYGTFNASLYGIPLNVAGRVFLNGTANDPYTGLPTGRRVMAQGYFNASASGHYEVEGAAPGTYAVYAEAAGFPNQVIATGVNILPGQVFHLDGYVNPGAVILGQVNSNHVFGSQPWPSKPRPIRVEIYRSNSYSPSSLGGWSPWNKTHAGYMSHDWPEGADVPEPLPVAFPWSAYAPAQAAARSYYGKGFSIASVAGSYTGVTRSCGSESVRGGSPSSNFQDPCGKPDGVGPAQFWWVDGQGVFTNGGGSSSFIFQFGVRGVFGAPTDMDGHVPQVYATWVNGLTAGRYWVRAWVNGYVQTLQDGFTFQPYYFDIAPQEWAGAVYTPTTLLVSSIVQVTVHFRDLGNTLIDCPIDGCLGNAAEGLSKGPRYLIAEVRSSDGRLWGLNFTYADDCLVNSSLPNCGTSAGRVSSASVEINGFGMMGPDPKNLIPTSTVPPSTRGMKFSFYRYAAATNITGSIYNCGVPGCADYGLPAGSYLVYVYMRGYSQPLPLSTTVSLSGSVAGVSTQIARGGRLNITVYSIDWEHPGIIRTFTFPGARLDVHVFDQNGNDYGNIRDQFTGERFRQPAIRYGVVAISGGCGLKATDTANHCTIIEYDGNAHADFRFSDFYGAFGYWPLDHIYNARGFLLFPIYYRLKSFAPNDALPSGIYSIYAYTYGYIQSQEYAFSVANGGFGTMAIQLLRGVNVTLNIPLARESVFTASSFNMTMRVRVFNNLGQLVATAQSQSPDIDGNEYNNNNGHGIGRAVPGHTYSRFGGFMETYYVAPFASSPNTRVRSNITSVSTGIGDTFIWYGDYYHTGKPVWEAFDSNNNGDGTPDFSWHNLQYGGWTTFIPAGTLQVRVLIAGVYDIWDPLSGLGSGVLATGTFEGKDPGLFYGIPGYSSTVSNSYNSQYTIEVDTWNQYPAPSFSGGIPQPTNWFPAVEGLLEGDSFHTIPGAAPDIFGYTGKTLSGNQLGPYAQQEAWLIPPGHLGSEVSSVFELNKRGYAIGQVYGFAAGQLLRTVSWVSVTATGGSPGTSFTAYSLDGHYDMYLDAGTYGLTVVLWSVTGNQGYTTANTSISISAGETAGAGTFQLEESMIAIPEFTGLVAIIFAALAASIVMLRKLRS